MVLTKKTVITLTHEAYTATQANQFIYDTNLGKLREMLHFEQTDGKELTTDLEYITIERHWIDESAASEWKNFTTNTLTTAGVPIQDYIIEDYTPPV